MNIVNIKKAIAIMERVKAHDTVYMCSWQADPLRYCSIEGGAIAAKTEEEFHACGNKACFAGHVAISPEFHADGGSVHWDGAPVICNKTGSPAIAEWLGVGAECADHLVHGSAGDYYSDIYPVHFWDVEAEHVITALNQLLELGEQKCLVDWA